MRARRQQRRGMTLVEVMVALVILVVMSGVIFESIRGSIQFQQLLASRDETVRTARSALSKLGRDLQLAYLTPNKSAIASYQTVFVGEETEPSRLYFASLAHQRLYLDSRECDQTEITVWGERAPSEVGKGYVLYHREAPRIDQYPDEQGRIWPLAYNVREFRVRYLDQVSGEWKTSWDTRSSDTPYRLPRAVELGLVLIAPDLEDPTGEETVDVPFLSTVTVEYAERMPGLNGGNGGLGGTPVAGGGGTLPGGMPGGMPGGLPGGAPMPGAFGGGGGGFGGAGFSGLPGGSLGGMLGLMGGNKGQGGRSAPKTTGGAQ